MEQVKEFKTIFEIENCCKASINDDMLVVENTGGMMSMSLKPVADPANPSIVISEKSSLALGYACTLFHLAVIAATIEYNRDINDVIKSLTTSIHMCQGLYEFIMEVINHGER